MTGAISAALWVSCAERRPAARVRLVCFPYAGGGAQVYRGWAAALPPSVEPWLVHLPGREQRINEAPIANLSELVAALDYALGGFLDRSVAFFGHSMGALLAFELARTRYKDGNSLPQCLILSAHEAPHLPNRRPPIHALPDDDFIEQVGRLNGTPAALLENRKVMKLLLPQLRADFKAVETYQFIDGPPLPVPITICAASDDPDVDVGQLNEWRRYSRVSCRVQIFEGGHFYLHEHRPQLLSHVSRALQRSA